MSNSDVSTAKTLCSIKSQSKSLLSVIHLSTIFQIKTNFSLCVCSVATNLKLNENQSNKTAPGRQDWYSFKKYIAVKTLCKFKRPTHPAVSSDVHKDEDERDDGEEEDGDHETAVHREPHPLRAQPVIVPHGLVVLGHDEGSTGTQHPG